jgi:hypothetical protein
MRMKKAALITLGLVGVITCASFVVLKMERLHARVVKLERSIESAISTGPHEPLVDLDVRIGRLEKHITTLETALENKIVRQELEEKLKHIRDAPPELEPRF